MTHYTLAEISAFPIVRIRGEAMVMVTVNGRRMPLCGFRADAELSDMEVYEKAVLYNEILCADIESWNK